MGKEIKEKYERVCAIKDRAIGLVESQLNGNIENVDAKELGEVVDIAKDMAEIMMYCEKAEYYHKVTEAMDESDPATKSMYLNKYIPEYEGKFYTDMPRVTDPRRTVYDPSWEDKFRDRMYYSNMARGNDGGMNGNTSNVNNGSGNGGYNGGMNGGRSSITRRTYMDMKDSDKTKKIEKLKEYVADFSNEMEEMFIEGKASPEEKAVVKQALAQYLNKM